MDQAKICLLCLPWKLRTLHYLALLSVEYNPWDHTNFFPLERELYFGGFIVEAIECDLASSTKLSYIMITLSIKEAYFNHFILPAKTIPDRKLEVLFVHFLMNY